MTHTLLRRTYQYQLQQGIEVQDNPTPQLPPQRLLRVSTSIALAIRIQVGSSVFRTSHIRPDLAVSTLMKILLDSW